MNLLDLMVKITAEDEASDKVENVSQNIIGKLVGAAQTAAKALAAMWGVKKVVDFGKAAFEAYSEFEQLAGGAEKIFNEIDQSKILNDANDAWRTLNMSANEYLAAINQTGAMFAQTMGDERGYETARRGMQAISDYASGTGRNINELNEKFSMITRSTSSYQSIADQFAGILPATSQDFLEQAQAAGLLADSYTSLTEVPVAEYQQAVSGMLERGVADLGLAGNTARESLSTITGSIAAAKAAWQNLVTEFGKPDADIAARVGDMLSAVFGVNGEGGLVRNVVGEVGTITRNMLSAVADGLSAGLDYILSNGPTLASKAMLNLASAFMDGAARIKENLMSADLVSGLIESISSSEVLARVSEFVSDMGDTITRMAPIVTYALGELWSTAVEAVQNVAPQIVEAVGGLIDTAVQFIVENGPQFVSAAAEAFMSVLEWITSNGPTLISNVATILSNLVTNVKNYLVTNGPAILQAALGMFRGILTAIVQHAPQVLANVATMIGQVVGYIAGAAGRMLSAGIQFVRGLLDGSTQQGQAVRNWFANLPSRLVAALGNVGGILVNAGRAIINGFWNGLKSAASGMFSWVSGIADTIASLKGPLDYDRKVLVDNGVAIMYGLQKGLESGFDSKVQPYVESVANQIGAGMTFSSTGSAAVGGSVTKNYYIDGSQFTADAKLAAALDVVAQYTDARIRMGTVRED